jgi:hypothetical protein
MAIVKRKKTGGTKTGALITNKKEPKSSVKKAEGKGTESTEGKSGILSKWSYASDHGNRVEAKAKWAKDAADSKAKRSYPPTDKTPNKIDSKKDSSRGK